MADEHEHEQEQEPLEGLEARLQSHAKAFESLLALTPARDYFGSQIVDGQDPSEQWNRKRQTKEQRRAAKKAKLDPANQKSALDVMREREADALKNKRKREGGEDDDAAEVDVKRQKSDGDVDAAEGQRRDKAARRKEKRLQKKDKAAEKKAKAEAKKARKQAGREEETNEDGASGESPADLDELEISALADVAMDEHGLKADDKADEEADEEASKASSAPTTPLPDSPAFDMATNHSATSSSSSVIPPSLAEAPAQKRPVVSSEQSSSHLLEPSSDLQFPKLQLPKINHEELQERMRKRIEELRAARKADAPDGKPAKSRQELLDQRRRKEEQRKAANKARRAKAKEDEQKRRDEQLRGSGSPLTANADIFSPAPSTPREVQNFTFSRLAFADGSTANPSLTDLQEPSKKKGPQDPKTALQAAQNKQSRLAGYHDTKQADIREKDSWLHARQRAQGERGRDDTSLLKKALKRKEKGKGKSEKEWTEREEGVKTAMHGKQRKREQNLLKRKEEKGGKKGKGKGKGKDGKKGKAKARPGFEGRRF